MHESGNSYIILLMTAIVTRALRPPDGPPMTDRAWRDEFRAALLDVDRRVVALDVRRWSRVLPGARFSVTGHLQLLRIRWRAVLLVAPDVFVPEAGPGAPRLDRSAGAARPAAVLRAWRQAGGEFPDQLTATFERLGRDGEWEPLARQRAAELAAVRSCLATVTRVGAHPGQN